jgi:uncharacterized ferritin-like protein (DUF455 family)
MLFVNAGEIIAAESLTYLYCSAHNMPLEFYYDLARHMWDEVRHSQMGVRRLLQLGFKIEDFRFSPPIKLKEGTDIKEFLDSYMELTNVGEACSFPYKRQAAESFWKFGDALSAIQSEFDVVDERKHVDYGNKWGAELYKQIYNDVITTKELNERGRMRRLIKTNFPNEEGYSDLVKNAHEFCGSITNLNAIPYDKY